MNRHINMFDLSGDYADVGLMIIKAWLIVFIYRQEVDVLFVEAKKVCHILKVEAFHRYRKDTICFTVGRVECNIFLSFGLPIDAVIIDESNTIVERSPSMIVPSMITVDSDNRIVRNMNVLKFGMVKIDV